LGRRAHRRAHRAATRGELPRKLGKAVGAGVLREEEEEARSRRRPAADALGFAAEVLRGAAGLDRPDRALLLPRADRRRKGGLEYLPPRRAVVARDPARQLEEVLVEAALR